MATQSRVAYFCMEYGLAPAFKIYSGGLGILAGDILKAAKDLNKPMVGIGILWRQGYVCQRVDGGGRPYDSFYEYRYPFLEDTGVTVTVDVCGRDFVLKIWKCEQFGNVPLYLLDAYVDNNPNMLITGQLYGWFEEERLAQEIILGVGGLRALEALGMEVDVYHFNDSHPVVMGLELVKRELDLGSSLDEAIAAVRKKIVFTTHTPVVAGNESYANKKLMYMGANRGLTAAQLQGIGGKPFGMTVAGLRLAKRANAVAQLHGETARKMWAHVEGGAPIVSVTNGVHNGTWQDKRVAGAVGEGLWDAHQQLKREMIAQVKERTGVALREDVLTIGFARRAAGYKRSDLIFGDPAAIEPLLFGGRLQIVFSGKAHPNDMRGKSIIANLFAMSKKYAGSVVFLEDYDMEIGAFLTRGCDVWLNNPVRPLEASGTSGMKAAMNGVLNLSVLDGWWPEGCRHGETGWQIGDGYEGPDADEVDRASLYKVLLGEVMPRYYEDRQGWLSMMHSSIAMSGEAFSAARMVEEYYSVMYKD